MSTSKDIILFHYNFSPFSKRIIWYLNFRKIPFSECIQPMVMPRPDLAALGVSYRRIPVLAIGRDIYNDTRLIIQKLETLFPPSAAHPSISSSTPAERAIEKLLELWVVDGGIFLRSAQLIPSSSPAMQDKKFLEDRRQFAHGLSLEQLDSIRPEAVAEIRNAIEFLETTFLADGREWLLQSQRPTLADIEGVWSFLWLKNMPDALPSSQISATHFPKTFAWMSRFETYVKSNYIKPTSSLKGPEVARKIENAAWAEPETGVDENDPSGLKRGQEVQVWPIDSGFRNKDRGKLVSLTPSEVVIESTTKNGKTVRIHSPRHGFRIAGVDGAKL